MEMIRTTVITMVHDQLDVSSSPPGFVNTCLSSTLEPQDHGLLFSCVGDGYFEDTNYRLTKETGRKVKSTNWN